MRGTQNGRTRGIVIATVAGLGGLKRAPAPGPVTKVTMVTMPQEKPGDGAGEGAP
jgi:hypothetical protein